MGAISRPPRRRDPGGQAFKSDHDWAHRCPRAHETFVIRRRFNWLFENGQRYSPLSPLAAGAFTTNHLLEDSVRFFADVAVEAATRAGQHLVKNFRNHQASVYGSDILSVSSRTLSKEITSNNDHEADEIIIGLLKEQCPSHNILTEETGLVDNGSRYTWIIDPLDGSSNFLNHNPFFAVSVCLAYDNEPITGVIFSPFLEEIVVARKGQGCTVNGRPVRVSTTDELKKSYVVGCPGGEKDNVRFAEMEYALHCQIKDFRKIGSAAVECYMVAAGRVDGFTTLNISSWDVAAGVLCAQEAGGRVTDFHDQPWTLEATDLLVSNGLVHDAIIETLSDAQIPGEHQGERDAEDSSPPRMPLAAS